MLENKLQKWLGYLGFLILFFAVIGGLTGFVFTSLTGFRLFTFSIAAWILSGGALLLKARRVNGV